MNIAGSNQKFEKQAVENLFEFLYIFTKMLLLLWKSRLWDKLSDIIEVVNEKCPNTKSEPEITIYGDSIRRIRGIRYD